MTCTEMASSKDFFEIITSEKPDFLQDLTVGEDYCEINVDEGIEIYYLPKDKIKGYSLDNYGYQLIPKIYAPQAVQSAQMQEQMQEQDRQDETYKLTLPLKASGIYEVKGEPLELTGLNTLIGLIDTGVRFTDTPFLDDIGLTRIATFWDQSNSLVTSANQSESENQPVSAEASGTSSQPPEGYLFGREYDRNEIQQMIDAGNSSREYDENGHGTALASVIANVSPLAEFAVVKLRKAKPDLLEYYGVSEDSEAFSETDILLAVKYLRSYAARVGKPMVICLGFGTNYGAHEGDGTLQQYLERTGLQNQIAIVVAAGNEAAAAHHLQTNTNIELRIGDGRENFLLECWSEVNNSLALTIQTPGGEKITGISVRNGVTAEYSFVIDQTRLFISASLVERGSGKSLIIIRFQNPTAGIWNLKFESDGIQNVDSSLNLWLPVSYFLKRPVFFLTPSVDITVTEPGTARRVITVGAYIDANGSIAPFSGRGPTVSGRVLPDFCAPGVDIETSQGIYQGTGVATAITVGAISLFLEWAVDRKNLSYASSEVIRNLFILGAKRENERNYPNNTFGYGKLNLIGVFEKIAGIKN